MGHAFPINPHIMIPIGILTMAVTVLFFRLRATKKPTSAKKILIPPLGMSTGFLMFLYPPTHIPLWWAGLAFLAGMVFLSTPLIKTSQLEIKNNQVYLKHSRAFVLVLVVLLIIRFSLHNYIEQHISIFQTAALFFILAFGMILPWRLVMYYKYRKLMKQLHTDISSS
ncbi:CcdC family protein [Thermoflavimicrobium dichotomicum]|uniref:Membrane protein CcdC involved in cytochrome C biogenesis n=1 Tax=Thermoflavimicrobium dichotomicum TaxID=46223 RepID=A0A1I3NKD6_9BACL|nr:cytochrome c biogenesis protein CcdC [Thermoflavimicrobium dichotomicum]SFJ09848.1 Membrane protein CcdC involved in cytochrome C biogenesis [Thermoflavimicrobium dichotomicum]